MNGGGLLVLTGFSGAGKDAVMGQLVEKHGWGRVVTHSAGRNPRPGEIPGKDYYFVQETEFMQMVERQEFLEYAKYGETWKGTTKTEISRVNKGERIVWRIDPTAAARAEKIVGRDLADKIVTIFLKTDEETRKKRVMERNKNGDMGVVLARLEEDRKLWEELVVKQKKFPYIVENREGCLSEAIEEIIKITNHYWD